MRNASDICRQDLSHPVALRQQRGPAAKMLAARRHRVRRLPSLPGAIWVVKIVISVKGPFPAKGPFPERS